MQGLMNYEQAAKYLGIAEITLKKWVQANRLPVVRFSQKCTKFKKTDLDAFINNSRVEAA